MLSLKPYYDVSSARSSRFSKNYSAKKAIKLATTYKGKVNLFEDYYRGWYLIPLKQNLREGTALITANILLSYCEVMEQFRKGNKSTSSTTGDFVKSALGIMYQRSMPKGVNKKVVDSLIEKIYEILRNGLHHDLAPRGVHIHVSDGVALMYQQDSQGNIAELWFNPQHFLGIIEKDFQNYVDSLKSKSDTKLTENFKKMFSKVFEL